MVQHLAGILLMRKTNASLLGSQVISLDPELPTPTAATLQIPVSALIVMILGMALVLMIAGPADVSTLRMGMTGLLCGGHITQQKRFAGMQAPTAPLGRGMTGRAQTIVVRHHRMHTRRLLTRALSRGSMDIRTSALVTHPHHLPRTLTGPPAPVALITVQIPASGTRAHGQTMATADC